MVAATPQAAGQFRLSLDKTSPKINHLRLSKSQRRATRHFHLSLT
jgi:hypothetical protein